MNAIAGAEVKATQEEEFTIARRCDAPREFLFQLWTERDHLAQWFGPNGTSIVHCTNDLRTGGVMHYGMRTPDGSILWGKWIYREIAGPERLIFTASFSDEAGGVTRHPFSAGWPLHMLSTVLFEEDGGGTLITVCGAAHDATELEQETFDAAHDSMRQGWSGTFDRLADYLRKH